MAIDLNSPAANVLAGTSGDSAAQPDPTTGTTASNVASAADSVQQTQDDSQAQMPVNSRQGQPPSGPQPTPPKTSLMSDILHAVAQVLGGPSTHKEVDPNTGEVSDKPYSREGRIANTAGIYLRGAAAGAAQHGPGAAGKAALAGVQEEHQIPEA